MYWEDEAFIVSKKKFRENAIIIDAFTKKFGKVSGIVYGGNSRKIKNYLQLINKIFVVYKSKNENQIGYFTTELIQAVSPKYFNNRGKTLCVNSLSSILKILLPENQSYEKIYYSLNDFLNKLETNNWLLHYLNWEIDLIKYLGYGFKIDKKKVLDSNKKIFKIDIDNVSYRIPSFLINKNYNDLNSTDITSGLSFSRNLLNNKIFYPNNIRLPYSRILLEN